MKTTFTKAAFAATLAVSMLAGSIDTSFAGPGQMVQKLDIQSSQAPTAVHWTGWPHHHGYSRGSRNRALIGGLVGGALLGAAIANSRRRAPEPRPAYRGGGNAHINWCLNRYRSYDVESNTFVTYSGRVRRCRSPYRR